MNLSSFFKKFTASYGFFLPDMYNINCDSRPAMGKA